MRVSVANVLSGLLGITLLIAIVGVIGLTVVQPATTPPYTEFYILGPNETATNYPSNLSVGESGTVIVGIENHEHQTVNYLLVVDTVGQTLERRQLTVGQNKYVHNDISFTFGSVGEIPITFNLYKGSDRSTAAEPYRQLHFSVNVTSSQPGED